MGEVVVHCAYALVAHAILAGLRLLLAWLQRDTFIRLTIPRAENLLVRSDSNPPDSETVRITIDIPTKALAREVVAALTGQTVGVANPSKRKKRCPKPPMKSR